MGKKKTDEFMERWLEVIEAQGDAAKGVTVWRKLPSGEQEWLASLSVHEMERPEELLSDRWGGGEYVTRLRDEKGRYMSGTMATFRIGGPPKPQKPEEVEDRKERHMQELQERIDSLSQQGNRSDALIMVELIRQQGELMRDLRNPPAGAYDVNPIELVTTLVTNVTSSFAPLVKEFLANRNTQPDTISRIEELTVLMELAKSMGGDKSDRSGFEVLAETLGKPIQKLVDQRVEQNNPPAAGVQPGQPGGADMAGKPEWYRFLNPIMRQALQWAAAGKDPEVRGELILDELTDEQLGPVYQVLTAPTFQAEFFRTYPEAEEHRVWFETLIQTIVDGIVPPSELEAQTGDDEQPATPAHPELGPGADGKPELGTRDPDEVAPGDVEPRFRGS